jgi:hypothetical protein
VAARRAALVTTCERHIISPKPLESRVLTPGVLVGSAGGAPGGRGVAGWRVGLVTTSERYFMTLKSDSS